ncbi:MAG: winged helix-turn-helix domain-containing protein [Gammaproteobacteria bacterium]|nr:winged helix-turn-helix domain-containing protein [Gammaproteobacteria bacterium]
MHYAEPLIRFANWRFERATGRLVRADEPAFVCKLEPRLHQLLHYFLLHPQQIISKDQLMDDVWPEGEGTDGAVMRAVASLRKTLLPGMAGQDCIETLSKRGYRWKVDVQLETLPVDNGSTVEAMPIAATSNQCWPEAKMPGAGIAVPVTEPFRNNEPTTPIHLHQGQPDHSRPGLWVWLMSAVLIMLVLLVFAVTLINVGKHTRQPVYSQMLTLSAMAGDEVSPLLHPKLPSMFYQYQAPQQQKWRWLQHDLTTHRKILSGTEFDALSQAIWLDDQHFLFQGSQQGQCHFYRQSIALSTSGPEALFSCQRVFMQSITRDEKHLYWLEQDLVSGQSQLWQRPLAGLAANQSGARLLYQFSNNFRRPANLILHQHSLYLVMEKDFNSSSLFEFELQSGSMRWLKDFSFIIHSIAPWQGHNLLISSAESLLVYPLASGQVIRLNTAHGYFRFAQRQGDDIVAVNSFGQGKDLYPLPLHGSTAQSAFVSDFSFASNKDDYAMAIQAGRIAFVSERSGAPQVWLQQDDTVAQLTRFEGKRQISQLIWFGDKLLGLIDLQLYQIDLSSGQLTLQVIEQPDRVTVCQQQLYWTQWSEQGWSLHTWSQDKQPQLLQEHVTDVRCGPKGFLVLQSSQMPQLRLWSLKDHTFKPLPALVDWRLGDADRWVTNLNGLYWLIGEGAAKQLMFMPWQSGQLQQITLNPDTIPDGLYADFQQDQLYYLQEKFGTADVVWLKQVETAAGNKP